jgi:hypothetical protein
VEQNRTFGAAGFEMVQVLGIAIKMKAKKADFDATMAARARHPTNQPGNRQT